MKKFILPSHIASCLFFLCCIPGFAQADFSPDRPGMATGPGVMDAGKVMWETGVEATFEDEFALTLPSTMFRIGLTDFAELRLEYDGVLTKSSYEVAPLIVGAKMKIMEGETWTPSISCLANLSIPCTKALCSEMSVAPSLTLLLQQEPCDWFNICYNIGANWTGISADPQTFLALCLGFNFSEKTGAFLESYNYLVPSGNRSVSGVCNIDAGFNFLVSRNLQLDIYAGMNLNDPKSMALLGCGVAWLINSK